MKGHVKKNLRKMLAMLLAVAMTVTYLPETSLMAFAAEGQESVQEADASQPAEAAAAETADNAAEDEAAADNATVADTAETPAENADATADSIAAENTDAATAAADPAAESSVGGQSAELAEDNAVETPVEPAVDTVAVSTDALNTYAAPANTDAPLLFGFNGDRYDENGYVGDIGLNMDDRSNYWAEWGGSLESGSKTIYIAPDSYWLEYNETDDVNENDIPIYIRMPAGSQKPTVSLDSAPGTDDWLQRVSLDNEWTSIDFSTNYGNDNTPDIVNYTCFRVILHVHERLCGGAAQFKINGETYTIDEAVVGYSFDNGTSWKFLTDPNAVVALDKDNTIQLGIFTEPDGDTLYRAVTDQPNHIGSLNDVADMLSVNNIASSNTAATNAWNDYCAQKDANENPISYNQGCTNDGRNYYYPIFTYGGDRSSNKPTTDVYYPSLTVAKDGACEVHLGIYSGPNLNIRISTLTGYALKQDDESKLVSQWDAGPNNKIVKPESGRNPKFYLYDKNSNPVTDDPNDSTYYLQDNPRFWLDGPVGYGGNVYLDVEETGLNAGQVYVALDFSNIPDTVWDEDFEVQFDCVVRKSDNDNFYREFNYRDETYRLRFASEEPDVIIFGVGDGYNFWDAGNADDRDWDDWRADFNHTNWDDWWIAEPDEGNPHITDDFLVEAWQYRVTNNHINKSGSDGKLYLNSGNIWGNTLIFYARIEADRDHATTRFEIGTDAAGGTNAWIKSIKSEASLGSAGHQSMTVGGKTYKYYKVELEVEKGRFAEWEEYIQVNTDNSSNSDRGSYKYHFYEMTPQYQISDNGTDWPMESGEPIWEELTNFDEPIALKKGQYIRFNVDGTAPDGNPRGKVEIYGMREQWKENSSGKVYYEFENETFFDRPVINKNAHDYLKEELGRDIYGENGNYQIFDYGNNSTPWYPVFKALDYGDNGGRIGAWDYGREMVGVDFRVRCMPDFSLCLADGTPLKLVTEKLKWDTEWEQIWAKSNKIDGVTGNKLRLYLYENGVPCTGNYEFDTDATNSFRFESNVRNYAVNIGRWYNEYGEYQDDNDERYDKVSDSGFLFQRDTSRPGNPWYIELTFKDGFVPAEEYRIDLSVCIRGMKQQKLDWIRNDIQCLISHDREEKTDVLVFGLGDNNDFSGILEDICKHRDGWEKWKEWADEIDPGFDYATCNPNDRWDPNVPSYWNKKTDGQEWGLKPEYYLDALNFALSNDMTNTMNLRNVIITDTKWSYGCYNWDAGSGKPIYRVNYRVLQSKDQGSGAFSMPAGDGKWVKEYHVEPLGPYTVDGKIYNYYSVEMFINGYMSDYDDSDAEFTLTTRDGTQRYYMREAYVEYQTKADDSNVSWPADWTRYIANGDKQIHIGLGELVRFRVGGNAVRNSSGINSCINESSRTHEINNGSDTIKGLFAEVTEPTNENKKLLLKNYNSEYDRDNRLYVFKQADDEFFYPVFTVEDEANDCRLNFDAYDKDGNRYEFGLDVGVTSAPDFSMKLDTKDSKDASYVADSASLMPITQNSEYELSNYKQNNKIRVPDSNIYKFYLFDGDKPVVADGTVGVNDSKYAKHDLSLDESYFGYFAWETDDSELVITLEGDGKVRVGSDTIENVYYLKVYPKDPDTNHPSFLENVDFWAYDSFEASMNAHLIDKDAAHVIKRYENDVFNRSDPFEWYFDTSLGFYSEYIKLVQPGYEPLENGKPMTDGIVDSTWYNVSYTLKENGSAFLMYPTGGKARFYLYKSAFDDDAYNESDDSYGWYVSKPMKGDVTVAAGSTVKVVKAGEEPITLDFSAGAAAGKYYIGTDDARDGQKYLEVNLNGLTFDSGNALSPTESSYNLEMKIQLQETAETRKSPGKNYSYSLSYSPATMMNWANVDENASTELGFGISGKMVFSSLFSNAEPEVVNVQDVIRDDYTFVTYLRIPDHFVPNGAPESYITIPRESNYVSDAQTPATGKVKNWFTSLKVRKLDLSDPEEETLLGHEHYDLASDGYAFYRLEVKGDGTKNLTRGAIRVTLGGVDYDFTFDGMKLQYLDTKELTTGQNPWDSAVESKWKDVPNGSAKLVSQAAFLQPGHDAYLRIWRGVPVENSPIRGFVVDGFGSGSFVIDSELNGNDLWNDTAAKSAWNTLMSTATDLPPQAEVNGDLTTWYDFTYNDGGVEKTFYPILHSINDATNPSDSAQENISDSFFSFGTAYVVSNEYDDAGWSDVRFRKHKYEFRYMDETKAVQDRTTSLYQGNAMPDPLKFYLYKDGEKFNLSGKVDSAEDLEFKAPNREYFQLGFYYDWTVSHKRWEWGKDVKWEMDANGDVYLSIARAGFDPDGEVGEGFDFKNHGFNYEIWAPISIVNQVWNEQSGQWKNKGKIRGAIMLDEKGAFFPVEDLGVDLIFVKNEGTDDEKATYRFVKSGGTTVVSLADGSFEMLLANIDKDKNIDLDTPITVVSSNTKVLALKNGGMPYLGEGKYLAKTFKNEKVQIVGVGTADLTISFKDNTKAAKTVKLTVTVKNDPAKNLSATGITFEKDVLAEYPYTGEAVTPEIVIKDGDYTLVAGTDYKVEPVNTAADAEKPLSDTKVGNGQFKITGLPSAIGYTGTLTRDFKIYGTLTYAYGTGIEKTPDGKDLPELPAAAKFYGAGLETLATVEAPAGYIFGWYTDAECKTAVTSVPAGTSANLTYYGKWAVVEYTIKYYDGDTEITGLTPTGYNYGTAVTLPAPAAKEGYTFEGWYAAKELTGDAVTAIAATETGDKVFYAKWTAIPEAKKYTVTFSVDGGSAVAAQTVEEGKTAEKPADPTKEGYVFEGWFADAELKTEFDFTKAITADVTVYAKWIKHHGGSTVVAGDMRVEAIPDQTYTGSALTPLVKVYDGNALLKEKTDYTIKYSDNTSVGTATVTITGKGSYTGSVTCQFKILPMSIAGEGFYATAPWEKYTGSEIKPSVKLFYGEKALTEGTDYEVSGSFTEAGEHTAVVTGKGNYTGELKVTFGIVDTSTTTLINDASVTYTKLKDENWTGSEIKPVVALKNGSTDLAENTDYTVSYRNNIGAGTGYVVVKGIGAYAGVLEIPFTIKGLSIKKAKVSGIKSLVYDGTPLAQTGVTVKITGKNAMTLRENVDYTLSYTNNLNVGKATVIITGIGGFSGSIKKTFKITAYDIKKDEKNLVKATLQAAYPYEKGGAKPVPDVSFGDVALRANTDFKLSYKNNSKAGKTAKVTITGKGNFKGSVVKEFNVSKQNISEVYMTVPDIKLNTGKGKYISKPVLYDGNGKVLKIKTDYSKTIKYTLADGTELNSKSQVTEAGTVITVTVTGAGSYEGTVTASYTIRDKSTTAFKIKKIKIKDQEFDGKPVTLDSGDFTTLKVGKNDLTLGRDFEILEDSYFDNDAKGTATVIIRGIGDYTGQKQVKFKVLARKIEIK